ncbi:unnamed protein product, partial [Protopolystoma xenopodis]
MIGGYIDIILKKQKARDHPGILGDEESAMYEENVRAERATIIQHQRLPSRQRIPRRQQNGHDEIAVSQRNGTLASVAPSVARDQLDHVRLSEDPG